MPGVRVVTDSSCDLPADLVSQLGIEIVPLTIRFGDEEFVDRDDLTPGEFWARCAASPQLPETAAPSPGQFEDAFRRAVEGGATGIVCINLSSKLSATIQSAQIAAKAVEGQIPVRIVDSLSATIGIGMMAIEAARRSADGADVEQVAAAAEDLVPRTRIYGALDTLENLKKGGRIGGAQALLGSMLSIKPVIQVLHGEVEQESKQRTRSRALRYLVDKVRDHGTVENLAVMHGDAPDLEQFLDMLSPLYPRDDIIIGDIGAVIGTHAGPRVIGVTFHVPR
jgi:DegV family protein with EDD domain